MLTTVAARGRRYTARRGVLGAFFVVFQASPCLSIGHQTVLTGRGGMWVFQASARCPRRPGARDRDIWDAWLAPFVLWQHHEPRPIVARAQRLDVETPLCCPQLLLADVGFLSRVVNIDRPARASGKEIGEPADGVIAARLMLSGVGLGEVFACRQLGVTGVGQQRHGAVVVLGRLEVLHRGDGELRRRNRTGGVHLLRSHG